jgi:prephenate dehydrogenase
MTLAEALQIVSVVIVNICGYVALGERLKRVEQKLDDKVDVEEHDALVSRVDQLEHARPPV